MKIRWKKVFYFVFLLGSMFGFKNAVGQNDSIQNQTKTQHKNNYSISGQIFETDNKTTMPFCNIVLIDQKNKQIAGTTSDIDGFFILNNLLEGTYTVKVTYIGYNPVNIDNILLSKNIELKVIMTSIININYDIEIMSCYKIPLIYPGNTQSGETFDSDEINRMPLRR